MLLLQSAETAQMCDRDSDVAQWATLGFWCDCALFSQRP